MSISQHVAEEAPRSEFTVHKIALIDDHGVARAGLKALLSETADLQVVFVGSTVREAERHLVDVDLVLLDLRLADGSHPADNVRFVLGAGAAVLTVTGGDDPADVRAAARAGSLGMVRKSDDDDFLIDAVRRAARGETVASADWAAALDSDPGFADANLSPREREVLALYASGEIAQSVAYLMGLSRDTVTDYISRIRVKYAKVGRPAGTKIDLHRRAVEDGLLDKRL